jgi:hypothetical protein
MTRKRKTDCSKSKNCLNVSKNPESDLYDILENQELGELERFRAVRDRLRLPAIFPKDMCQKCGHYANRFYGVGRSFRGHYCVHLEDMPPKWLEEPTHWNCRFYINREMSITAEMRERSPKELDFDRCW